MSEPNNSEKNKTSSHWAVSEEDCENMAERNQWKLLETRKDDSQSILDTECIFEGETSFADHKEKDND